MNFIIASAIIMLAIQFICLTWIAIRHRRQNKLPYGTLEDKQFQASIAAHRNFIEYVPFILLVILYFSTRTQNCWLIAIPLFTLVIGRLSHSIGLLVLEQRDVPSYKGRVIGMILTLSSLIFTVITLMVVAL